jgi:hypothetical protein
MNWLIRLLALIAQALAAIAAVYCAWIFGYAWMLPSGYLNVIPLVYLLSMNACCLYGVWVVWTQPTTAVLRRAIWATQGIWLGFIVAGMWSIGLFFVPSWLILSALALIDLARTRTNLLLSLSLIAMMVGLAIAQTAYLVAVPRIFYPSQGSGVVPARPAPTVTQRP